MREAGIFARRAGGWFAAVVLVAFAGVALAAAEEPAAVTVEKGEVAVEYKRFDPAKPPDPPPPLEKGEAAACVYGFGVGMEARYAFDPPGAPLPESVEGKPVTVGIRVDRVKVKLSMTVTIWLPTTAGPGLADHEEGHRQIAERFYADAETFARAAAARQVGKRVSGAGKDAVAAGGAALDAVNQRICDEYVAAVNEPCQRAQAAFDRLTNHGLKASPTAKEAVELAVKEGREK